jgi:hypothetical protein
MSTTIMCLLRIQNSGIVPSADQAILLVDAKWIIVQF